MFGRILIGVVVAYTVSPSLLIIIWESIKMSQTYKISRLAYEHTLEKPYIFFHHVPLASETWRGWENMWAKSDERKWNDWELPSQ